MEQKYHPYRIYFKDIPLLFTDDPTPYTSDRDTLMVPTHSDQAIREVLEYIENMPMHSRVVFHGKSPDELLTMFKSVFGDNYVLAGGGVVFDELGRVLVIYRNRRWDLPKGKMEPGETVQETAIRETREETGLKNLNIRYPFIITHHYYYRGGRRILKETHWFAMEGSNRELLVPAQHEGIEKAQWIPVEEISSLYDQTYANLLQVFDKIIQMHTPQPDEVADASE